MLSHLTSHVIPKYLTVYAKSHRTDAAIKLEVLFLMFLTLTKNLRLLGNRHSLVLIRKLRLVAVKVALRTEICLLSNAV